MNRGFKRTYNQAPDFSAISSMSSIASPTLMLPNCSSNLDFGAASTLPISQASENSTVSQQLAVRASSVVGPSAWNDLPFELWSLLMAHPTKFYISLKSFFFVRAWLRAPLNSSLFNYVVYQNHAVHVQFFCLAEFLGYLMLV